MNLELAEKTRALIKKYPERHDQNHWASDSHLNPALHCGTSACIAGWVLAAQGMTLAEASNAGLDPAWTARDALGITDDEADALFYDFDNESALERFDEMIAEAKVARDERVVKA